MTTLTLRCFPRLQYDGRDGVRTCLYQTVRSLLPALVEFRLVEALLHVATWLIVITSSSACIWLQANLLWHTKLGLRSPSYWMVAVGLLVAGLLSAGTFSIIVTKATVTVDQLEMGAVLNILVELKAVILRFESVFSAIFTAIVAPMCWAGQLDLKQKKSLTNLLLWHILLFLHWNILIPTFFSNAAVHVYWFESLLQLASFVYQEEQGILDSSELQGDITLYPLSRGKKWCDTPKLATPVLFTPLLSTPPTDTTGKCDVSCLTFRKIFMQDEGSTSAEGIKETGVAMIPTLSIILGTNRTVHASTSILHILGIAWTFGTLPPIVFAWHIQQLPGPQWKYERFRLTTVVLREYNSVLVALRHSLRLYYLWCM
ncbi:hypothetical protein EMCRGX_G032694 [Ephydatia muelleri]